MDRLRRMNVRTLLNTRIDLSSLRAPPFSPYTYGTPTVECADTPDLSPTFSTPDLFESPYSTPPPASPHIPSFSLPPPVVQPEDFCATIRTMDGRKINADLIVRSLRFSSIVGTYLLVALLYRPDPQYLVLGGAGAQINQPRERVGGVRYAFSPTWDEDGQWRGPALRVPTHFRRRGCSRRFRGPEIWQRGLGPGERSTMCFRWRFYLCAFVRRSTLSGILYG